MERPDGPAKRTGTAERGLGRLVGLYPWSPPRCSGPSPSPLVASAVTFARFLGSPRGATALRRRLDTAHKGPSGRRATSKPRCAAMRSYPKARSTALANVPFGITPMCASLLRPTPMCPADTQNSCRPPYPRVVFLFPCHRHIWASKPAHSPSNRRPTPAPISDADVPCRHAKFLSTPVSARRIPLSVS